MTSVPLTRPLSELEQVDWQSFELPDQISRDIRIDCAEIPGLLHRAAEGKTYNSFMGPELSAKLLDFYEYTMHLQFTPVVNEVLPFLLGILKDTDKDEVRGNILRFLAWAFMAAANTGSAEVLDDAFFDFSAEKMPEEEKQAFREKIIETGREFMARLPDVAALAQPFLTSPAPFVRGAASRFLLVAGVLLGQSDEELSSLFLGKTEVDPLLNAFEMSDFFMHQKATILPNEPYHRLTTLEAELFEHTENQAWLWEQWTTAYEVSEYERVKGVMETASQHPEAFLPALKSLYGVMSCCHGEGAGTQFWAVMSKGTDEEMREAIRAVSQRVLAEL